MGERAGLAKKVSPQTLRRTYGSLLLNATLSDTRVRFPPPPLLQ
jgi:site-specific recombinase XerD